MSETVNQILHRLQERFNPATIAQWSAETVPSLITAILILLVYYLLWKVLNRGFGAVQRRVDLDPTVATFVGKALRYLLFTLALLSALAELGINTAAFVASLGIAGLTLGFAAKDTLSNVISGLFIFWDRPFVLGDLIETDGKYGRVQDITLRSTRLVTPDGKMLAVPNSTIVNNTVASYTNEPHLRIEIDVTVGVNENLSKIRHVFLALVKDDAQYMAKPSPEMVVVALNDYNVAVQFRIWLINETDHLKERFSLRERIYEALRQAGVDMPFETLQLAPFEVKGLAGRAAA